MVFTRSEEKFNEECENFEKKACKKVIKACNVIVTDEESMKTKVDLVIELYDYINTFIEKNKYVLYRSDKLMRSFKVTFKKINQLRLEFGDGKIFHRGSFIDNSSNTNRFYKIMNQCEENLIDVFKNHINIEDHLTKNQIRLVNKKKLTRRDFNKMYSCW